LDLQKPTGAIARDELQKALLNQGVQSRRDETDDCTKLSDMQKLERIGCYRIDYSDETARSDQSGSGNYDGKTLRKGHTRIPVYVLLQKMAARETEAELLKAYPQLSETEIMAVWEYAARAAAEEIVLAESRVRLSFG
jgi:uncharacterized protein (DUF433 family)